MRYHALRTHSHTGMHMPVCGVLPWCSVSKLHYSLHKLVVRGVFFPVTEWMCSAVTPQGCNTAITIFYLEMKACLILLSFTRVKATQLPEISWQPDLWHTLAFSSVLYEYVLKTHRLSKKIQHQRPKPKPNHTFIICKEYSYGKLHWYT